MRVLLIDTASFFINLAIIDGTKITHHQERNDNKLSDRIFPLLENIFASAGITPQQIEKVYVTNGPGTFTGIRVGLSIAKTFAWNQAIPLCSISSLALYASGYDEDVIICIQDKNDFGFVGYYTGELDKQQELYTNINQFVQTYPNVKQVALNEQTAAELNFEKLLQKYATKEDDKLTIAPNYLKHLGYKKMNGDKNG